jgi:hypothetical protein
VSSVQRPKHTHDPRSRPCPASSSMSLYYRQRGTSIGFLILDRLANSIRGKEPCWRYTGYDVRGPPTLRPWHLLTRDGALRTVHHVWGSVTTIPTTGLAETPSRHNFLLPAPVRASTTALHVWSTSRLAVGKMSDRTFPWVPCRWSIRSIPGIFDAQTVKFKHLARWLLRH